MVLVQRDGLLIKIRCIDVPVLCFVELLIVLYPSVHPLATHTPHVNSPRSQFKLMF